MKEKEKIVLSALVKYWCILHCHKYIQSEIYWIETDGSNIN